MSNQLKRLIKKKQRVYNRAKHFQRLADWEEFKAIRRQVHNMIKSNHRNYLSECINYSYNLNGNKHFWQYIKSRKQESTTISALQTSSGMATTANDKAETLNNYFKSIFTVEDTQNLPEMPSSSHPPMQDINITPEGVHTLLSKLKPTPD